MKQKIKHAVLAGARLVGLFALCRMLTRSKIRILCYHGGCLDDESAYNPKLFCSSATLSKRMAWLQQAGFHVVSLDQAVEAAQSTAARPALTTAITFDDGWYSTASELIPVLGSMNFPSTLYLCTKHFLEGGPVTSVAVHYLLWKTRHNEVRIEAISPAVDGSYDLSDFRLKQQLATRLSEEIEKHEHKRIDSLEQLASCLGISKHAFKLASRRFDYMNSHELAGLAPHGCTVELHGHVHHYPAGDPAAFKDDLKQCHAAIVGAGLPAPRHYCYPSGNFDAPASSVLAECKIVSATTCIPGLITTVDPVQAHFLPRFLDGESISMLEFQSEMSGFSDLLRKLARRNQDGLALPA